MWRMKGGKDEGKPLDPLFPRLHINDADQGGPKAPPRNRMALCEQYNTPSLSSRFSHGSMAMLPIRPINRQSSSFPQASSSQIGGLQQKVLRTCRSFPGSSHLAERDHSCYSTGVNLGTSLTNSEPRMSAPRNYQNSCVSGNSMATDDCNSSQPHGFNLCHIRGSGENNDFRIPFYGRQSGMTRSHDDLQLHLDKERLNTFTSISAEKLHNACLKQQIDHERNHANRSSELYHDTEVHAEKSVLISSIGDEISARSDSAPIARNKVSELDNEDLKPTDHHKRPSRLVDPYVELSQECSVPQESKAISKGMPGMPERIKRKRCTSGMDDSLHSSPQLQDVNELFKVEMIKECSKDEASGPVQGAIADKKQEISGTLVGDSIPVLDITPDDVAGLIGHRLFWKARSKILHQQRTFAMQIFELHRLIKVQRLIAGSPEVLYEKNFYLNKPSTKFPPNNKLLYVAPLGSSPVVTKPKAGAQKLNHVKDCSAGAISAMLPPPIKDAAKGSGAIQPTPASIPNATNIAPWCFHLPGNQWLVPTKSPSEGLIYKPYTGPHPHPPPLSILAPVFSAMGGTAYGIPAPDSHRIARFPGYLQPYPIPLISHSTGPCCEVEQPIPSSANFDAPCQSSSNLPIQQSGVASDCDGNLQGSRGSDMQGGRASSPAERLHRDALSLFPTAPSLLPVSKDQSKEQSVQVIKVVPHNPKSAPESAARIFQSIQEERNQT